MAKEHMKSWQVGDVTITRVVEVRGFHDDIQMTMPEATAEEVVALQWLPPALRDARRARQTRMGFAEKYADSGVLVIGAHFAAPTAGHIHTYGADDVRFDGLGL